MALKRTPLYESHLELSAKMVDFAGWEMPIQYSGILEEHMKVRHSCGLFDVSHMGDLLIEGKGAREMLSRLLTNNIDLATEGKGVYSHILRPDGTIIDDTIVYKLEEGRYLMVPNAATKDIVLEWVSDHNDGVSITDLSGSLACMAVQGPMAESVLQRLTDYDLSTIERFHLAMVPLHLQGGVQPLMERLIPGSYDGSEMLCLACRTGYTGEDGFELLIEGEWAPRLWESILMTGGDEISPAGLGCRDTLRLEKGLLLSGTDFDGRQTSLQTGPRWVVKFDHDFIGKDALEAQADDPDMDVLVGIVLDQKGVPRHGYPILRDGERVGEVTSGTMSPMLKKGIAMGYVPRRLSQKGERVQVEVRGNLLEGKTVTMPFV